MPGRPVASQRSLDDSRALFIRRWGEMGGYWGISRTMAEIHAMLYVSIDPVCTDDVMDVLQVSRGNASMNLRALVDWGLIERIHLRGDRKEYFVALTDVWKMFETIIRQRTRREVQPILETIRQCRDMVGEGVQHGHAASEADPPAAAYLQRLDDMRGFLEAVGAVVELLMKVGPAGINQIGSLMAMHAGVAKHGRAV